MASGVQPEEARRSGCYGATFHWNPPDAVYWWEGLQGPTVCSHVLALHGFPNNWNWVQQAQKRAFECNLDIPRGCTLGVQDPADTDGIPCVGNDAPMGRILNYVYVLSRTIAADYTAMRSVIGLDWYLGV